MEVVSRIDKYAHWLVALAAVALYLPTLGYGFVLDDAIVITENHLVQQGLSGWWDIWTHDSFFGFFGDEDKAQVVAGGRYRPLSIALFALLYAVVGDMPWVYHLFAVLSYGACCAMVFEVLRRWLSFNEKVPSRLAILAALLFVVHPVHVEAVANVKGVDETLSALFAMIALHLTMSRQWSAKHFLATSLAMLAALLTKEHTITLLGLAPLVWYTSGTLSRRGWAPWLALFMATALYTVIRLAVIGWPASASTIELMNNPMLAYADGQLALMEWTNQMGTNLSCLIRYLRLLVWPHPLSHDYYPRAIPIVDLSSMIAIFAMIIHAMLLVFSLWTLRPGLRTRRPKGLWVAVGLLWYLMAMMLYTNIPFSVGTHMAERFLFWPSVGGALAIAATLLCAAGQRLGRVILGIAIVVCAALSLVRMPAWADNYTLFTTDVAITPGSAKLQNAVAGASLARYEQLDSIAKKKVLLHQALLHANLALDIHPRYATAALIRANALLYLERYQDAIDAYDQLLQRYPVRMDVKQNLVIALQRAGRYYGEQRGDLNRAKTYLMRAHTLEPEDEETLRLLGVAYGVEGQHERAIHYFEQLLALSPSRPDIMKMIATAYHHLGRLDDRDDWLERIEKTK